MDATRSEQPGVADLPVAGHAEGEHPVRAASPFEGDPTVGIGRDLWNRPLLRQRAGELPGSLQGGMRDREGVVAIPPYPRTHLGQFLESREPVLVSQGTRARDQPWAPGSRFVPRAAFPPLSC